MKLSVQPDFLNPLAGVPADLRKRARKFGNLFALPFANLHRTAGGDEQRDDAVARSLAIDGHHVVLPRKAAHGVQKSGVRLNLMAHHVVNIHDRILRTAQRQNGMTLPAPRLERLHACTVGREESEVNAQSDADAERHEDGDTGSIEGGPYRAWEVARKMVEMNIPPSRLSKVGQVFSAGGRPPPWDARMTRLPNRSDWVSAASSMGSNPATSAIILLASAVLGAAGCAKHAPGTNESSSSPDGGADAGMAMALDAGHNWEPVSVASAVTKVKNLLIGQAATDAEVASVTADQTALVRAGRAGCSSPNTT